MSYADETFPEGGSVWLDLRKDCFKSRTRPNPQFLGPLLWPMFRTYATTTSVSCSDHVIYRLPRSNPASISAPHRCLNRSLSVIRGSITCNDDSKMVCSNIFAVPAMRSCIKYYTWDSPRVFMKAALSNLISGVGVPLLDS